MNASRTCLYENSDCFLLLRHGVATRSHVSHSRPKQRVRAREFSAYAGEVVRLPITDERHIAPIDEGGVALAAIQGLKHKLDEKEDRIRVGDSAGAKGTRARSRKEGQTRTVKKLLLLFLYASFARAAGGPGTALRFIDSARQV